MPGGGHTVTRPAPADQPDAFGAGVVDVYLNDGTRWAGVPSAVWTYTLGGYPVLKKWLSTGNRTCSAARSPSRKSSTSNRRPAGSRRCCCSARTSMRATPPCAHDGKRTDSENGWRTNG